jgi:limonene-1,2-epoxide hydrolase
MQDLTLKQALNNTGQGSSLVRRLITLFEALKIDEAMMFFTSDATYRFGNAPKVFGREAIRESSYSTHMDQITGIDFKIMQLIEQGNTVVAELEITYTLHNSQSVVLPCTDIFELENGQVKSFRIYMDPSPLFSSSSSG